MVSDGLLKISIWCRTAFLDHTLPVMKILAEMDKL